MSNRNCEKSDFDPKGSFPKSHNDQLFNTNATTSIERQKALLRMQQAALSFNLAMALSATLGFVGLLGIYNSVKEQNLATGVFSTIAFTACAYCRKLAKDANDRL
ncbi:hypothetical protein LEP3755_28110 [Leptolyngbya sp. NIES-3755]|nr:hypothetical protein LEP3755_28110 [Leptolyngbya sp. NIES-3755]